MYIDKVNVIWEPQSPCAASREKQILLQFSRGEISNSVVLFAL